MIYTGNCHVDSRTTFFTARNQYLQQTKQYPDLILFGDSITEGMAIGRYGLTNKSVLNCGIGGERLDSASARIDRDVLQFHPSAVHLMLGINDLLHYPERESDPISTTVDHLFELYEQILKQLQTIETKIYCGSIIKLAEIAYDDVKNHFTNYVYLNQVITELNQKISDYCDEYRLTYIDYNQVLTNQYQQLNRTYTTDGVHLNEKGYFEMFKMMKSAGVL